jgi:hypothetical protein
MYLYFKLLGLPDKAPLAAIKTAYRKLAFQYHPDRNQDPAAHQKFIEITEAYEILIGERKAYRPGHTATPPPSSSDKKNNRDRPKEQNEHERNESIRKVKEAAAKRRYNEFMRESKSIRNSIYSNFLYVVFYLLFIGHLAIGIVAIVFPFVMSYIEEKPAIIAAIILTGPIGVAMIIGGFDWRKDFMPYFTGEYPKHGRDRKTLYRKIIG